MYFPQCFKFCLGCLKADSNRDIPLSGYTVLVLLSDQISLLTSETGACYCCQVGTVLVSELVKLILFKQTREDSDTHKNEKPSKENWQCSRGLIIMVYSMGGVGDCIDERVFF